MTFRRAFLYGVLTYTGMFLVVTGLVRLAVMSS